MKIYLDDEREAPEGWTRTYRVGQTLELLVENEGAVTHLSLDHDLGTERTGYTVLLWMERMVFETDYVPPEHITVHSANSGARPKMELAIEAIRKKAAENLVISDQG